MSDPAAPAALTLFGIPNCDQVRKARAWLAEHGIEAVFHDLKMSGLTQAAIEGWLQRVDWDTLVNRKGTTWRALDDARKAAITSRTPAVVLMLEQPSIVKRPVLQGAAGILVGFDPARYATYFTLPHSESSTSS